MVGEGSSRQEKSGDKSEAVKADTRNPRAAAMDAAADAVVDAVFRTANDITSDLSPAARHKAMYDVRMGAKALFGCCGSAARLTEMVKTKVQEARAQYPAVVASLDANGRHHATAAPPGAIPFDASLDPPL